jgi:hypothetical protein
VPARVLLLFTLVVVLLIGGYAFLTKRKSQEDLGNLEGSLKAISGAYVLGDGKGDNRSLEVRADNQYWFTLDGCMGLYHECHGSVTQKGSRLILASDHRNASECRLGDLEFELIRWDQRIYLVPDSQKDAFCTAVNSGNEPRQSSFGTFYVRCDLWNQGALGRPDVPETWEDSLDKWIARGRVVGTVDERAVTVNLGSHHGITLDSVLWQEPTAGSGGRIRLRVQKVDQGTCVAAPVKPGDRAEVSRRVTLEGQ